MRSKKLNAQVQRQMHTAHYKIDTAHTETENGL